MITVYMPYNGTQDVEDLINQLKKSSLVTKIILLTNTDYSNIPSDCKAICIDNLFSSKSIKLIIDSCTTRYFLFITQSSQIQLGQFAVERFFNIINSTDAAMVYSNHFTSKDNSVVPHPVNDYQIGSLRDDFDFGPLFILNTRLCKTLLNGQELQYAGLYELRLHLYRSGKFIRIPEYLYTAIEVDSRKSGAKQFDYVNPKNRDVQIEMEKVVTEHLKKINAYLAPSFNEIENEKDDFEYVASVVIPVKNRVSTIEDAINSVLIQKTEFKFNLIVVDNYSTDGTTEKLKSFANKDSRVIHLIPERKDLGIGGCWNEAIHHPACGKYAIQLDSDDIYENENTIQAVVEKFIEEKCAMVIGSYKMTNFKLEEIPPGLIDHKEWTPENGRNNALRINGLGAPRAFYTPILRQIKIPNVSYGEDYAVGLMISREYKIGRIYEPIYLCRRWEGNSDATLDIEKLNSYNEYKDKIRTIEVIARQKVNKNVKQIC